MLLFKLECKGSLKTTVTFNCDKFALSCPLSGDREKSWHQIFVDIKIFFAVQTKYDPVDLQTKKQEIGYR